MTYTTHPPSRRLEGAPTLSGDYGHVRPRLNELSVEARVAQLRQAHLDTRNAGLADGPLGRIIPDALRCVSSPMALPTVFPPCDVAWRASKPAE